MFPSSSFLSAAKLFALTFVVTSAPVAIHAQISVTGHEFVGEGNCVDMGGQTYAGYSFDVGGADECGVSCVDAGIEGYVGFTFTSSAPNCLCWFPGSSDAYGPIERTDGGNGHCYKAVVSESSFSSVILSYFFYIVVIVSIFPRIDFSSQIPLLFRSSNTRPPRRQLRPQQRPQQRLLPRQQLKKPSKDMCLLVQDFVLIRMESNMIPIIKQ